MSRISLQQRRLRFFRRGNTLCPICLTEFTESDVRAGKIVTLEHAPQEALGGKPACLTCKRCNTGPATAMMDRAVALHHQAQERGGYQMTIQADDRCRYTLSPENYDIGEDQISINVPGADVVGESFERITLRSAQPKLDAVLLGLVKSAYLMVFSLMGATGYRYAQGQAVASIREQLLSPEKERSRPPVLYTDDDDNPHLPEHAVLLLTEYQCWAVKIHTRFVILPPGGSIDRYRRIVGRFEPPLALRSTVQWTAPKFGGSPVVGRKSDKLKTKHVFGASLHLSFRNRRREYVVVYEEADMVAALPVSFPELSTP